MAKPFTSLSPSGDATAPSSAHFWRPLGEERVERGMRIGTGERGQMSNTAVAVAAARPLFTVPQWQELELQAIIYKYLAMGKAVPDTLVHHFRNSVESMVSRYYIQPSASACVGGLSKSQSYFSTIKKQVGYSPYFGKDLDPEPWRCRRTDGKKWRCSKEAYPDSKYCDRHMHRGRNRSRKPVEAPPQAQSPCASTVTSLARSGSGGCSFQSIPLNSLAGSFSSGAGSSQLSIYPASYGIAGKEFRYPYGMKGNLDEHSLFSEASESSRGLGIDSSLDNSWCLMPSPMSSHPLFKAKNNSSLQSSNLQFPALKDPQQASISSLSKPEQQQQQHSFFSTEFGSVEPAKHESRSLRPFFDEWPRTKDMWSDLEDERTNRNSFSTTQLSISMPMTSSGFSTTNSRSPNDD